VSGTLFEPILAYASSPRVVTAAPRLRVLLCREAAALWRIPSLRCRAGDCFRWAWCLSPLRVNELFPHEEVVVRRVGA
jgi:hypothetical protein